MIRPLVFRGVPCADSHIARSVWRHRLLPAWCRRPFSPSRRRKVHCSRASSGCSCSTARTSPAGPRSGRRSGPSKTASSTARACPTPTAISAPRRDTQDFWLSLRFKCEADGNSGVYIHTEFKEGTVDVSQGKQFEIDRTLNHHTGGLYGEGRGWYAWPAPEFEQVIRPTDWNEMLLKVEGNHFVAILNGIEILNFTDPAPKSFDGYIALSSTRAGWAT